MAKRLFLIGLLAVGVACKSTRTGDKESEMSAAPRVTADLAGRDAVERALLSLGIDGRVLRVDLNEAQWEGGPIHVARTHLLSTLLVLETKGAKPRVFALNRNGLQPRWVSDLREPTAFRAAENLDLLLLTSEHFVHTLEKSTGRRAMMFVGGSLDGLRRPALQLPFMPTGGAAAQNDSLFVPSLGSSINNKTIESFSLVTGARGWGHRSAAEVFTSPIVGGDVGDPKLYFVTRTGQITCMDAKNYGFPPPGPRWEELLEAGVEFDMFLTPDTRAADGRAKSGSLFVVDKEGMVYCLDRATGERLWVNATGRRPTGGPEVFGDVVVVRMKSGLIGFDADNVLYTLTVASGPDQGQSFNVRNGGGRKIGSNDKADWVLSDPKLGGPHATLKVEGEVLTAVCEGAHRMEIDGGAPVKQGILRQGSRVAIGGTVLEVQDRGADALWTDLDYDRIVGRVGDSLVAAKGKQLLLVDAFTGRPLGPRVSFAEGRFIPVNHVDGNLFVLAGDAVVYALFAR